MNTETNFHYESQNEFDLISKKKNPSSTDKSYQLYDKKTLDEQDLNSIKGPYLAGNQCETVFSASFPCIANQAENSNTNFAFNQTESISEADTNKIKMQETCEKEVKFTDSIQPNKSANLNSKNSNLNINNYNSNLKTDKNIKSQSSEKQNMVIEQISKSPIAIRNLSKQTVYLDENHMDIEMPIGKFNANNLPSNNLNCIDMKNLNSNSNNNFTNVQNKSNNPNTNYSSNANNLESIACYAYEANANFPNKENVKSSNVNENRYNYNVNVNNFNNKNSKHNYDNYKKKPSAAYSKPTNLNTNSVNTKNINSNYNNISVGNLKADQNQIPISNRQNITNITTVNSTNINANGNLNQQNQLKPNTDCYSKFIPILQKHEKSIPLEYIPEIWRSLKTSENCLACMPKYDSLLNQTDINFDMRAILIDWIIDVHKNYRLFPETLYICISIIDRYLTKKQILRTKLQLLGTTALFISSKYEEIVYPCIEEFTKVTDDAYNKEEVLQMENEIFQLLEFDLTYPSAYRFFEIISLNYNFSEVEFFYGCYLLDYFLISPNSNKYFPSVIALAVVLLILKMKNYENYRDLYSLTDSLEGQRLVKQCAKEIYEFPSTCKNFNLHSVFNKYSSSNYHCVALNELDGHQQASAGDAAENASFIQTK